MVFYNNINPVAFSIFGLDVYWYGIIFALGFIIAYYMLNFLAKEKSSKLTREDIDDFFFWFIISVLAGARLVYVLVYNLSYFVQNPLHIFFFWEGGLSFHGGFIGAVVMGYFFCRKRKVKFYDIADLLVIPLALALMFGRIANFINGELYGRITTVPWAFKFKNADGFRHPSQLYESFKNLTIFTILWNLRKKELPKGFMFWLFVTLYGTFRFVIEFVREPDSQIGLFFGWMSMGQILCLAMVVVGVLFLIKVIRNHKINIL